MSTSGSTGVPSSSMVDTSGVDFKTAFMLWGIVMAFLVVLVVLRIGCNVCIDIVILRDSDSLLKTLSELRRAIFPNWHPRTQPQDIRSAQPQGGLTNRSSRDVEGGGNNGVELMNMDRVLSGLTPKQKQDLLVSVLPSKVRCVPKKKQATRSVCGDSINTAPEPIRYENNTFCLNLIVFLAIFCCG
jgi:hypothetical protein